MLSDVVRQAAEQLAQAAARLEAEMNRFASQAGRAGTASAKLAAQATAAAAGTPAGTPAAPVSVTRAPGPATARPRAQAAGSDGTGSILTPLWTALRSSAEKAAKGGALQAPLSAVSNVTKSMAGMAAEGSKTSMALGSFSMAMGVAALSVGIFTVAMVAGWKTMLSLASKANPSAAATYAGSWDLLMAKMGRTFVPFVQAASSAVQKFADVIDSSIGPLVAFSQGLVDALFGEAAKPALQAMQTPWQSQISSGMEFADRLQQAATGGDELQAEILREQLKSMQEMGMTLKEIRNSNGIQGEAPSFR